jgi:hypothetical protein
MCKDKGTPGEICHWVAETAIPTYVSFGYEYGNQLRMGYALPKWIQGKTEPLIMLIDDYSRGSLPMLQAVNEIMDKQEYLSWNLPKGSTIILTSNPDNGEYLVQSLDNAMETRKLKFEMKFEAASWAIWAEKYGVDSRAINFILKHPEVVEGDLEDQDASGNKYMKANIRLWTKYFDSLSGIPEFTVQLPLVMNLGAKSIPPAHVILFTQFIKEGLDKLMSPSELLNCSKEKALEHLKAVIDKSSGRRQDIAAIMTKRLTNYAVTRTADITASMAERFGDCLESGYLSTDLVITAAKKLAGIPKFSKVTTRTSILKLIVG